MFNDFEESMSGNTVTQIIDFPTWSRTVNNELKESTLDHIYLTDPTICTNIESLKPCFGDHMLITITICSAILNCALSLRRDWRIDIENKGSSEDM